MGFNHRFVATMAVAMKKAAAMKAMKAMKTAPMKAAMKAAMKTMKAKKVKKVSKIAKGKMARSVVFRGLREKTVGGLKKDGLKKNKGGKVVSKKSSVAASKRFA